MDPTARWLMSQRPGVLLWEEGPDADGVKWAWCTWAEVGAEAHGSKVRTRFERVPASCWREAVVERPPMELGDLRRADQAP